LKIALTEPVTLPVVAEILLMNKRRSEKSKIKNITDNIIREHVIKGHHFEVAWALWICKEFEILVVKKLAELIFNSNDVVSIIIALDLKQMGLINSTISIENLELELNSDSLMDNKWLLTYESCILGLVNHREIDLLAKNEYFNLLRKKAVGFYDSSKTLIPVPKKIEWSGFDVEELVTNVNKDKIRKNPFDY